MFIKKLTKIIAVATIMASAQTAIAQKVQYIFLDKGSCVLNTKKGDWSQTVSLAEVGKINGIDQYYNLTVFLVPAYRWVQIPTNGVQDANALVNQIKVCSRVLAR